MKTWGLNYKMNFGEVLAILKHGGSVSREGWNGKGMFLYLVPANNYTAQTEIAKKHFGDSVPYETYIALKTVQNSVVPWLASQTDLLAEDWKTVE